MIMLLGWAIKFLQNHYKLHIYTFLKIAQPKFYLSEQAIQPPILNGLILLSFLLNLEKEA